MLRKARDTVSSLRKLPKNIKVLAVGWLFWSPVQAMAGPYLQLYVSRLGATPEELSLVQSIQQYANAAARVIGGYISDRHGRKKIIWIGTLLVSLAYLIMVFASDWRTYALASGLNSLFLFYQPALEGIQADSVALEARGRIYSFVSFMSGLASSVAPLGGATVVNALGLIEGVRLSFLLSAVIGFFIAWIRMKYMEETLTPDENGEGFVEAYKKTLVILKGSIAVLMMVDIATNFIGGIAFLGGYYQYYYLGVDKTGLGVLATIGGVISLILTLPAGYIADKKGRGFSIFWGFTLGTVSLLLFVLTPPRSYITFPLLVASTVFGSIGGPLYGIAYSTLRADLVPKEQRGRVYAVLGIPPTIAWSVGAGLGGWMYSSLGPQAPFTASLLLRLLLTPLLLYFFWTITKQVDAKLRDNEAKAQ